MIKLIHGDCLIEMNNIESNSINVIFTDPPYKYLKNQKLEVDFDETIFFNEAKRVLKKDGFIVLFGRGSSFYRWNTMLDNLGFIFKEEIIWDKRYCSSPLMNLSRVHETVSIHTKKNGTLNKVKVPYLEMKKYDIDSIIQDIKRIKSLLKNTKSFDHVIEFLKNNNNVSNNSHIKRVDWAGKISKNEITADNKSAKSGDRNINIIQSIIFGLNEKSIIKESRNNYSAIHPTEKPVRLLERLLALVTKRGCLVLDPFGGSFSTVDACINLGLDCIAIEIDKEFYDHGKKRIDNKLKTIDPVLF